MERDIFQEINKDIFQEIIVSLEEDVPVTLSMINLLKGFMDEDSTKETELKVFCPGGDQSCGVYVVMLTYLNKCKYKMIKMYSREDTMSILEESLITTRRLDWSNADIFIEGLYYKMLPVLETVFLAKNVSSINKQKYIFMSLPSEAHDMVRKEVIIPEGFVIRSLTSEDAELIDNTWAYHSDITYDYIHHSIVHFGGLGLAHKHNNHLVSWAVGVWNTIGIVHTLADYRHRSYAQLVIRALAKQLIRKNVQPICLIKFANTPSLQLFKKLGFNEVGLYYCTELSRLPEVVKTETTSVTENLG
ncbi:uncharacterized protein LOC128986334 [Macrosteles quadrilineatus]|uniref:uncharacterized protein LOC128986334 n=1 Tax=Macrosteles quadrilineatus TaxID=74068 RepID=UPI0023E18B92|nr:uncharacterized protein LOC128986334 [Macrosteles quadrilineatus]XP_054262634.1 uncharacterized protein LOC128986334 [Macrosteles quadrilineatus]